MRKKDNIEITNVTNSSISINGKIYNGDNISININKDVVYIDGKKVDYDESTKEIKISIVGNIDNLIVERCKEIIIDGDVNNLQTTSGDVNVSGNVNNEVSTTSGDVKCQEIYGNVNTTSGDVSCDKITGNVKTVSGDIY